MHYTDLLRDEARPSQEIAVIGSGYVGLTLAACMAALGHTVTCTDISTERIRRLTSGDIPIVEDGLPELVLDMVACRRLSFGTDNTVAVARADFVFLCLPTPEGADGHADLQFVRIAAKEIGPCLRPGATVITKSTVPVGTAELIAGVLGRVDIEVVSNPEFLAEGTALRDSLRPDRIVIGARSREIGQRVADLYGRSVQDNVILTDVVSAELVKYASNAYLATRLTFVNSMAEMCEIVGADIRSVVAGMGADHRIGKAFLRPGPGWGGSCFPKDTQALVRTAERVGADLSLVEAAIAANDRHTARVATRIEDVMGGSVAGRTVAIWGLTFKAGTNDLRDSPALDIARLLRDAGAHVKGYDPTATGQVPGVEVCASMEETVSGADVLLIATEWHVFAQADLELMGSLMRTRIVVDGRNILSPEAAGDAGFEYIGMGIGHVSGRRSAVVAA